MGITTACSTTHTVNMSTTILGLPLSPCILLLSIRYTAYTLEQS